MSVRSSGGQGPAGAAGALTPGEQQARTERASGAEVELSSTKDAIVTITSTCSGTGGSTIKVEIGGVLVGEAFSKAVAVGNPGPSLTFVLKAGEKFKVTGTTTEKLFSSHRLLD